METSGRICWLDEVFEQEDLGADDIDENKTRQQYLTSGIHCGFFFAVWERDEIILWLPLNAMANFKTLSLFSNDVKSF
jgi:hypothetical protein